jgi:hypothetical protein
MMSWQFAQMDELHMQVRSRTSGGGQGGPCTVGMSTTRPHRFTSLHFTSLHFTSLQYMLSVILAVKLAKGRKGLESSDQACHVRPIGEAMRRVLYVEDREPQAALVTLIRNRPVDQTPQIHIDSCI